MEYKVIEVENYGMLEETLNSQPSNYKLVSVNTIYHEEEVGQYGYIRHDHIIVTFQVIKVA